MERDRVICDKPRTHEDLQRLAVYGRLTESVFDVGGPQPYTGKRLHLKSDPPVDWPEYFYEINGPFISTVQVGTSERCGPETVRMLNLAYRAGQRHPISDRDFNQELMQALRSSKRERDHDR